MHLVLAIASLLLAFTAGAAAPAPKTASSFGSETGELVPNAPFTDADGGGGKLLDLSGPRGLVVFTRDAECPVSQRYMPTLERIARDRASSGYRFVIVDVTPHDRRDALEQAKQYPWAKTLWDPKRIIASRLQAQTTAEAFLVDSHGTLKYRGAIDDQFGITYQKAAPTSSWLSSAIEQVGRDGDPVTSRTEAPGCAIAQERESSEAPRAITYHNRISRIIQSRCESCHRAGGLAPMPLQSYRDVFPRRAAISAMVTAGIMPPWSARQGIGHWANDRSLSERDKKDLLAWANGPAPEGDVRDAPAPRKYSSSWNIGAPDAIVRIPEEIAVPAQGPVEYKYVFTKTDFKEDKWITALEVRPTNPKAVHHVLVFLEEPGRKQPGDGVLGFFAATVPGSMGAHFPPGTGKRLPAGAWLRFEIHYQPTGRTLRDRTEIGFQFSKKPLREVQSLSAPNTTFVIPPFVPHHKVVGTYDFKQAGEIVSLFPHMHLRGSAFRYDLRYPDGKTELLLDVPKFDFNWQGHFELLKPLPVPAGARLIATAWYDNSKNNPWNPDPSKTVRWGRQTDEEMMIGYFDFIADAKRH